MDDVTRPENEEHARDAVAGALAGETPFDVVAGGSKRGLGRHPPPRRRLDLSALAGITLYEPEELVLSAAAATKLADIEARLDEHDQWLAFEPPDYGPLLGEEAGAATIGGVLACNHSGPRRIRAGAARDHFLGVRAVTGRGEIIKSGGRVVKNVTGYDMCKLLAGSYGTLAVMTEITVKVLPAPEKIRTVLVRGLDDAAGVAAMTQALQSPHDVSAAAHLPSEIARRSAVSYVAEAGAAVTAVRIEGPEPSVAVRCEALRGELAKFGEIEELHRHNSIGLWREVGDVAPFVNAEGRSVWRLSVPPSTGAEIVAAIAREMDVEAYYDWGGGLIWLAVSAGGDAGHEIVRRAIGPDGGHATLIRGSEGQRSSIPVFHPQPAPLAALTARIKEGFDPRCILNPGRMYKGV